MRIALRILFILTTLFSIALARADEPEKHGGPPEFKKLKYRLLGPAVGGRVSRAAGVPGDPLTYYAATASGGVWKTSDGGLHWKPVFDDQPDSSIGSIAVAASDPNVIYVGAGEANIRGNVAAGHGIYKSTDAGRTWKHVWQQEGQIGTMIVHPTNADIAFAAVLGKAFGPNDERGVYRTTDGGKSWQKVLFKDADTGASDVCFDPSNPRNVFAGLWQARRKPWEMTSGGPGSGLYVSRDGGDTWKQLVHRDNAEPDQPGKGLPEGTWGKVGVAVAPSNGQRIYALIEAEKGGLYRSDDGGHTWSLASGHKALRQRAWYYSTLTVHPTNADVVWCPQVPMLKSIDGGKTFRRVRGIHHGDNHDIWIDPKDSRRMIGSNDGGVDISADGGASWHAPRLPIAQFYHVSVDNSVPYRVSGAMQDLGTADGPSNSLSGSGITLGDWLEVGGGEAGHTAHDPNDPNIVYAGEYGGYLSRFDRRTRQARNVGIYPTNPSGHGGEDLRYRFQWTAPLLISPHDPKTIYHGGNVLFQSTDGGQTWAAISGDLTRNDKTKQKWSGGPITGDNTGVEIYCTIFAVAESPKHAGVLWAGSDDGLVHVSRDGGKSWTNVTDKIAGIPQWGTVACIEPSPHDAGTAYVAVDAHRLDDARPYLFMTTDFGGNWKRLDSSLPRDVYLHAVREDPVKKGVLYVGTERGVAMSLDGGVAWQQLKLNLPTVAVHDLRVKDNDLVVGTHGRSIWVLDDLTAVRELSTAVRGEVVHLFPPRPSIRWRYSGAFHDNGPGQNPPAGAAISYYLKDKPKEKITLEILDAQGKEVAKLTGKIEPKKDAQADAKKDAEPQHEKVEGPVPETAPDDPDAPFQEYKPTELTTEPGVNRVVWDFRYSGAKVIPGAKVDAGMPKAGPLVVAGSYTLKLAVDGKSVSAPLTVLPDPRVKLSPEELDQQLKFALTIRDDINKLTQTVEQLRSVRGQLAARNALLKDDARTAALVKQSRELMTKLDAIEGKLHNPKAEVAYDILAQKGGAQLYSKLSPLFEWVKDADGKPTQGMRDVYAELARELQQYVDEAAALLGGEVRQLNALAQKLDVPTILVPKGAAAQVAALQLGPDSQVQPSVPKGTVTKHTWKSAIFPGTERDYYVYVPAQYDAARPACVMVFQDGHTYVNEKGDFRVPTVFDNLIHKKEMPVTIGIFINPGNDPVKNPPPKAGEKRDGSPWRATNRSFEYDTLSDQYVRFLEKEILPEVGKHYNLRQDATGRAICGISSGGICAFTAAWQRPDLFSKVLSHVGSFTNIRGGDKYPGLIRKTAKKPIRIYLQDGSGDLDNEHGNWPLGNQQMALALKFKGYDYRFEYGDGGHNGKHGGAILPDSLRWLWREETK